MVTSADITAARKFLGESPAAFGRRFGVAQSTVWRWENRGLPNHGTSRRAVERFLEDLRKVHGGLVVAA